LLKNELSVACHRYVRKVHFFVHNGCFNNKSGDGRLVVVKCPFREMKIEKLHGWAGFREVHSNSWGLRVESTMLQCVETCTHEGCEYSKQWLGYPVDSEQFSDKARALKSCGSANPPWPSSDIVPVDGEVHAKIRHILVGSYRVNEEIDSEIYFPPLPLEDPYNDGVPPPDGWTKKRNEHGDVGYAFSYNASLHSGTDIGTVHVKLFKEAPQLVPNVFMMGLNINGTLHKWYAPWPCNMDPMNWRYGTVEFAHIETDSSYFVDQNEPPSRLQGRAVFVMLWWVAWSGCACTAGEIPGFLPHDRREDSLDLYVCMTLSGLIPAVLCLCLIVEGMEWILPHRELGIASLVSAVFMTAILAAITIKVPFNVRFFGRGNVQESARSLLAANDPVEPDEAELEQL